MADKVSPFDQGFFDLPRDMKVLPTGDIVPEDTQLAYVPDHVEQYQHVLSGSVESVPVLSQAQFALQQAVLRTVGPRATAGTPTAIATEFLKWLKENDK